MKIETLTRGLDAVPWLRLLGIQDALEAVTDCIDEDEDTEDIFDALNVVEAAVDLRICETCDGTEFDSPGEGTVTLQMPGEDEILYQGRTVVCEECADNCSVQPGDVGGDELHPDVGKSWREVYGA